MWKLYKCIAFVIGLFCCAKEEIPMDIDEFGAWIKYKNKQGEQGENV